MSQFREMRQRCRFPELALPLRYGPAPARALAFAAAPAKGADKQRYVSGIMEETLEFLHILLLFQWFMRVSGGGSGIRTHDGDFAPYSLSRGAPSATRPSLRSFYPDR